MTVEKTKDDAPLDMWDESLLPAHAWAQGYNAAAKDFVGTLAKLERMRDALRRVIRNDKTKYKHHERRPSDGKTPFEIDGGSCFLTPAEIARAALEDTK